MNSQDLAFDLTDARRRTLELIADLSDEQLMGPRLDIVNPLLWEIGHVAWFQEFWILRTLGQQAPLRPDGDRLYDSAKVDHRTRWDLPLPSRGATVAYMEEVLARVLARLRPGKLEPLDPRDSSAVYFVRLALFHEDMHGEAFAYTRQTLAYPAPPLALPIAPDGAGALSGAAGALPGDAEIPGGKFMLGATPAEPFVFDNEKWAHPAEVGSFRMARATVTQGEFAAFVDAGGYEKRACWSDEGWMWRERAGATHPLYWERAGADWRERRWDSSSPLSENHPVIHVNAHEADAYCRWARRRLPSEAEWEYAARGGSGRFPTRRFPWGDEPPTTEHANLDGRALGPVDVAAHPAGDSAHGCRQMIGNVWEWTSSRFGPYPGFVPDPYKEYSEPWFATDHRVLRGGGWATRGRLLRNTWRNFYEPHRRDIPAGFRTCAV